jgi:O-acetyl-ADP-ribose deacetylase (regulator of RNase III)
MDKAKAAELTQALAGLVRRPAGAPPIAACLDTIERVGTELGGAIPARLKHYLTNRSYEKALLFLEGDAPATAGTTGAVMVGKARLELVRGDITKETTEAIANAANMGLTGGAGVNGAILAAGGPAIMDEIRANYDGCPVGSAVITGGGNLKAKYVLHAVGPQYAGAPEDAELLESAYQTCLILCAQHRISSVAFPSISTGIFGYPVDEAAPVALKAVADHLATHDHPTLVRFVLFDAATFSAYGRALEDLAHNRNLPHEHR